MSKSDFMAIFSIALRSGVILEELILLSGRAILHRILPRDYILLYARSLQRFMFFQGGNTGTVNVKHITFRNDIMYSIVYTV